MKLKLVGVVWHDAAKADRRALNTSRMILTTFGVIVHEDDGILILASEVENEEGFVGREIDYTQIPKKMILVREEYCEVDLPIPLKKKRAKNKIRREVAKEEKVDNPG